MVAIPKPERASPRLSESEVQAAIRKHVGALPDVRLWRNNVGELRDRSGRSVRYGLSEGSSDLVGIVGPRGRWLAIEVKAEGWRPARSGQAYEHEEAQRAFHRVVRAFGGVAGFATSVDEAMVLVEEARG